VRSRYRLSLLERDRERERERERETERGRGKDREKEREGEGERKTGKSLSGLEQARPRGRKHYSHPLARVISRNGRRGDRDRKHAAEIARSLSLSLFLFLFFFPSLFLAVSFFLRSMRGAMLLFLDPSR